MTDKDKEAIEIVEKEIFSYSMPLEEQQALGQVLNLIQTQQEEIERLKQTELKAKGGIIKVTLEGLLEIEKKILDLEEEIEKKDTLIHTMQAEFERLENLEDNTDMLKLELQKKDKIINEMAIVLFDEWYMPSLNTIEKIKEYFIKEVEKEG